MPPWAQILLALSTTALLLALVLAVLALRRLAQRAENVLAIVEQELRPLVAQAHGLTDDVRQLTREARRELEQIGMVTARLRDAAGGVAQVTMAVAAFTRAGQIVSIATGLRRGFHVFLERMRKTRGGRL